MIIALAAAGMLTGHVIGYGISDATKAPDHGYLSLAGPIVGLIAVLVTTNMAIKVVRRAKVIVPSWRWLLFTQVAFFVVLETTERVVTGSLTDLGSLPVLLGLAAQIPVAIVLRWLTGTTVRLISRWAEIDRPVFSTPEVFRWHTPVVVATRSARFVPVGLRGPPVLNSQ